MPSLSDAEIEAARQRGQAAAASEPRAVQAWVEGVQLYPSFVTLARENTKTLTGQGFARKPCELGKLLGNKS